MGDYGQNQAFKLDAITQPLVSPEHPEASSSSKVSLQSPGRDCALTLLERQWDT